MTVQNESIEDQILASIRRIVRAIDLHSRRLVRDHQITGPQLVTLRGVKQLGPVSVSALARAINLGQPTVTGILMRLERQGLILRQRRAGDRREVVSTITPEGSRVIDSMPSLLQDRFLYRLSRVESWERTQILSTLQRIAWMMDAEEIPADPVLETEPLLVSGSLPPAREIDAGEILNAPAVNAGDEIQSWEQTDGSLLR